MHNTMTNWKWWTINCVSLFCCCFNGFGINIFLCVYIQKIKIRIEKKKKKFTFSFSCYCIVLNSFVYSWFFPWHASARAGTHGTEGKKSVKLYCSSAYFTNTLFRNYPTLLLDSFFIIIVIVIKLGIVCVCVCELIWTVKTHTF